MDKNSWTYSSISFRHINFDSLFRLHIFYPYTNAGVYIMHFDRSPFPPPSKKKINFFPFPFFIISPVAILSPILFCMIYHRVLISVSKFTFSIDVPTSFMVDVLYVQEVLTNSYLEIRCRNMDKSSWTWNTVELLYVQEVLTHFI